MFFAEIKFDEIINTTEPAFEREGPKEKPTSFLLVIIAAIALKFVPP